RPWAARLPEIPVQHPLHGALLPILPLRQQRHPGRAGGKGAEHPALCLHVAAQVAVGVKAGARVKALQIHGAASFLTNSFWTPVGFPAIIDYSARRPQTPPAKSANGRIGDLSQERSGKEAGMDLR